MTKKRKTKESAFKEQFLPLLLTVITFIGLCVILWLFIKLLNLFPSEEKIQIRLQPQDILVGLTIYLKTSIDFAIFIGNLMSSNPGWQKRIAIELGTAIGNASGRVVVLLLWNFFREVPILMALMIFVASLVLLRMAEESIEEFLRQKKLLKVRKPVLFIQHQIGIVNAIFKPFLKRLVPHISLNKTKKMPFIKLIMYSFTIPFILGLDDFAGYIPLFSVINVFGFAVGVFLGHMILNLGLFISPKKTVSIVKHPAVLIIGGLAFVGIASWGLYEVYHLVSMMIGH